MLTLLDSSEAPPVTVFNPPPRSRTTVGGQARPRREPSSSGFIPSTIANSTRQNSAANRTNQLVAHTPKSQPGSQAKLVTRNDAAF